MGLKLFFLRGEIQYTPSERREKYNLVVKGERSGYKQDPVISIVQMAHQDITLTAKGKEYETCKSYSGWQGPIVRWAGKAKSAGRQRPPPSGQARPDRQAETLTHEGANQDIKESGHRSRRPPTYKGYNQFIKDARRLQRATQLSQLKPMEGKI